VKAEFCRHPRRPADSTLGCMCIRVTGRPMEQWSASRAFSNSKIVNLQWSMSAVTGMKAIYPAMRSRALGLILAVFILLTRSFARAAVKSGSNGELKVTVTVVSSVGITIGPNGEQRVVVANAPELQREFESMFRSSDTSRKLITTKTDILKPNYIDSAIHPDGKHSEGKHSDSKPIRRRR
jgi:hypothetical protein